MEKREQENIWVSLVGGLLIIGIMIGLPVLHCQSQNRLEWAECVIDTEHVKCIENVRMFMNNTRFTKELAVGHPEAYKRHFLTELTPNADGTYTATFKAEQSGELQNRNLALCPTDP